MNLERFVAERSASWDELDTLVQRAGRRAERLGADGVRRLAVLYRGAGADLALARRRFAADPVTARLERLVASAWHLVYDVESRRETVLSFFATGYWRRLVERPWPLVLSAALLLVPSVLGAVWATADPDSAQGFLPGRLGSGGPTGELSLADAAGLSGLIFVNNIRVSFLAFAGGIAVGLGSAFVLAFNGVMLGTVAGIVAGAGQTASFAELVVPQGVLELSCVVATAAAGMRMGWAIVDPRALPRGRVLVAEGRRAVEVVLGTIPWFVLAGLVEGFVTPAQPGLAIAVAVGVALAAVFWGLAIVRGRASA